MNCPKKGRTQLGAGFPADVADPAELSRGLQRAGFLTQLKASSQGSGSDGAVINQAFSRMLQTGRCRIPQLELSD